MCLHVNSSRRDTSCQPCTEQLYTVEWTDGGGAAHSVQLRARPVAGVEAYYDYDAPGRRRSSNTGLEESGTAQVALLRDAEGRHSLLLQLDATRADGDNGGAGSGGFARMALRNATFSGTRLEVAVRDDGSVDPLSEDPRDQLQLHASGELAASLSWVWGKDQTDGAVLRGLPEGHDQCFTLQTLDCSGLERIRLQSWVADEWVQPADAAGGLPPFSDLRICAKCAWPCVVRRGLDLYRTPAPARGHGAAAGLAPGHAETFVDFGAPGAQPIADSFFDVHTAAWAGRLRLHGCPLPGAPIGAADTAVERLDDMDLSAAAGAHAETRLRIAALSLCSLEPVRALDAYGQLHSLWDVHVCLSSNVAGRGRWLTPVNGSSAQPLGRLEAWADGGCCAAGDADATGTYELWLPVLPRFTFTRRPEHHYGPPPPPTVRVLDFGVEQREPLRFHSKRGHFSLDARRWAPPPLSGQQPALLDHDCAEGTAPRGPVLPLSNFFPLLRSQPCRPNQTANCTADRSVLRPYRQSWKADGGEAAGCRQDRDCARGYRCAIEHGYGHGGHRRHEGTCVPETRQCAEAGDCPADHDCRRGSCVWSTPRCRSDYDCQPAELLECGDYARCRRRPLVCRTHADCARGLYGAEVGPYGVLHHGRNRSCSAAEGVCTDQPTRCSRPADCHHRPLTSCLTEQGVCGRHARHCEPDSDDDCLADEICDGHGSCHRRPSQCFHDSDCAHLAGASGPHHCQDEQCHRSPVPCAADAECDHGAFCTQHTPRTCSFRAPQCSLDEHCPQYHVCGEEGRCVLFAQTPCYADGAAASGYPTLVGGGGHHRSLPPPGGVEHCPPYYSCSEQTQRCERDPALLVHSCNDCPASHLCTPGGDGCRLPTRCTVDADCPGVAHECHRRSGSCRLRLGACLDDRQCGPEHTCSPARSRCVHSGYVDRPVRLVAAQQLLPLLPRGACRLDADYDGVCDEADNCPAHDNAAQHDHDHDGVGDACDSCPRHYNPCQHEVLDRCGECLLPEDPRFDGCLGRDCHGTLNGTAAVDGCGVCSGGESGHTAESDRDCDNVCFGTAVLDGCGQCANGTTGRVPEADRDECGVCFGAGRDLDCAGVCFGSAAEDGCGVCSGGTTGHEAESDRDCKGACFGTAVEDSCQVCAGRNLTCARCPRRNHERRLSYEWRHYEAPRRGDSGVLRLLELDDVPGAFNLSDPTPAPGLAELLQAAQQAVPQLGDRVLLAPLLDAASGRVYLLQLVDALADYSDGALDGYIFSYGQTPDVPRLHSSQATGEVTWDPWRLDGSFSHRWPEHTPWRGMLIGPLALDGCLTLQYAHGARGLEHGLLLLGAPPLPEHGGPARPPPPPPPPRYPLTGAPAPVAPLSVYPPGPPALAVEAHRTPLYQQHNADHASLTLCLQCRCPWRDACGVCGGDNSSCADCFGEPNGAAQEDQCGVCGGDGQSCLDCAGVPHGRRTVDECGVCLGPRDPGRDTSCVPCFRKVVSVEWRRGGRRHSRQLHALPIDPWVAPGARRNASEWYRDEAAALAAPPARQRLLVVNDGRPHLVALNGPGLPGGGRAWVELAGTWGGQGVQVEHRDDVRDRYLWSSTDGLGSIEWRWAPHRRDGVVLGPLPAQTDLCLHWRLKASEGLEALELLDWNARHGELRSRLLLPLEDEEQQHGAAPVLLKICCRCNATTDCAGVGGGLSTEDQCGVCRLPDDPARDTTCLDCLQQLHGPALLDECGTCRTSAQDPLFNAECLDCAGEPNGAAVLDECGQCAGDGSSCAECPDPLHSHHFRFRWLNLAAGQHAGAELRVSPLQYAGPDAASFYGYSPGDRSAHLPGGLEAEAGTQLLALLHDAQGRHSLVVVNGRHASGDHAETLAASLYWNVSHVLGAGTDLLVRDDPAPGDEYAHELPTGVGHARWEWPGDETDGLALGPLLVDSCVQLRYGPCAHALPGGLQVVSQAHDAQEGDIDVFELPVHSHSRRYDQLLEVCSFCDCPWHDACGTCHGNGSACAGCDGVPNSGAVLDACGVCAGDDSSCLGCDDWPNSGVVEDACGVCGGTNATCLDCHHVVNGPHRLDACGKCLLPGDGSFNDSCRGCDGVPGSGRVEDACGVCGGDSSSCAGCDGVPNSGLVVDRCYVCGGDNSSCVRCPQSGHRVVYRARWLCDGGEQCGDDKELLLVPVPVPVGQNASEYYDYRDGSSHSGLEQAGHEVLAFAEEHTGHTALLLHHGAAEPRPVGPPYAAMDPLNGGWSAGGGGRVTLSMDTLRVAGRGMELLVQNDPRAQPGSRDRYRWNPRTGLGRFRWRWNRHTNDGMVMGAVPFEGCVLLSWREFYGLDNLTLISHHPAGVHRHELPLHPGKALQICSCCDCAWRDACGVCHGDNSSCLDCAGVPNGPGRRDYCGKCRPDGRVPPADRHHRGGRHEDCSCRPPHRPDRCGVCDGDGTSCLDCRQRPWGRWTRDHCGRCRGPHDPARGQPCRGGGDDGYDGPDEYGGGGGRGSPTGFADDDSDLTGQLIIAAGLCLGLFLLLLVYYQCRRWMWHPPPSRPPVSYPKRVTDSESELEAGRATADAVVAGGGGQYVRPVTAANDRQDDGARRRAAMAAVLKGVYGDF